MNRDGQIIPIYLLTGFLESGKTTLLHTMLKDERFTQGQKTLVIGCEEGEVEYDKDLFAKTNTVLVTLDAPEELGISKLRELNRLHRPERVIIEYNNVWGMKRLGQTQLPLKWRYTQIITLADATTFDNYMTNMRQLLTDPMKEADLVMVNRCTADSPKSAWRRQIRAMNPNTNVLFEGPDGEVDDGVADEDLPYDMKADVIDITEDQMAIAYMDSLDHPERYDGKTIRLNGQIFRDDDMPPGYYLFGRLAMTCCADDIARLGWITQGTCDAPETQFMRLTARCRLMNAPDGRQGLMLQELQTEKGQKPKREYLSFT